MYVSMAYTRLIHKVNLAKYGIRILVAAAHGHLNTDSLRRPLTLRGEYEYGYSWGRPINGISLNIRGYSMRFHL